MSEPDLLKVAESSVLSRLSNSCVIEGELTGMLYN